MPAPIYYSRNPDNTDYRFNVINHTNFPNLISEFLKLNNKLKDVPFTASYNREGIIETLPLISWKLEHRIPGVSGNETLLPRLRGSIYEEDNSLIQVYSQQQTCIYQFDCYAEQSGEADDLSNHFEDFLISLLPKFQTICSTSINFFFSEQLRDNALIRASNAHVRSLRFKCLFEKLWTVNVPTIAQIELNRLGDHAEEIAVLIRGQNHNDNKIPRLSDKLSRPYISDVIIIADTENSITIGQPVYVLGVDYEIIYDNVNSITYVNWLPPGKRPENNATYYVKYTYWTGLGKLQIS